MSQDGKLEEFSLFPKTTYLDSCITSPPFFSVCFSNLFKSHSSLLCLQRDYLFSSTCDVISSSGPQALQQRELHCMNFPVNKLKLKYYIVPGTWQESTVEEFYGVQCQHLFKRKCTFIHFFPFLFKSGVFSYKVVSSNMISINLFGRY